MTTLQDLFEQDPGQIKKGTAVRLCEGMLRAYSGLANLAETQVHEVQAKAIQLLTQDGKYIIVGRRSPRPQAYNLEHFIVDPQST